MDRDIAMVFQNYALYPHMSVFDNMAYGLKIAGTPKGEITARVEEAARLLQLDDYLKRRPRELSGGQRQRVAMGRAIVRKPAVFLFDEPLSNLDAKLRVQMRLEIKQLQRRLGVTSLYVTHDQVEAMTLADRMIVMNAGVADQIGAPLDVYSNPQTEFVGGFIGSPPMNFLDVSLGQAMANDAARLGVRPEHITIADTGAQTSGEVLYTEALGAETLVHVKLGDGSIATVRQDATKPRPEEGAQVGLAWDRADQISFDAQGKRC
jgi:sn-glycerol 3-phosphate transport system ATP-binding protein